MFSENKKNIQTKTTTEKNSEKQNLEKQNLEKQNLEKQNTNTNQKDDSRKIVETVSIYDEYLECLKNNPEEVCKDFKLSFDKTDI